MLDTVEELLLTRLELLEALELSELDELIRLELELIKLATELLVVVGGGLDLVPPLPPPQPVKVKTMALVTAS